MLNHDVVPFAMHPGQFLWPVGTFQVLDDSIGQNAFSEPTHVYLDECHKVRTLRYQGVFSRPLDLVLELLSFEF